MSLSGKIAKGTAIFSSSTIALTTLQFLTSVLVIRALGQLDYGRLALALSAYSIGTIFLDLGLGAVISSEIARSRGKKSFDQVKRFLLRYSQMQALGGLFLLTCFIVVSFWLRQTHGSLGSSLILIVGIYLFLSGIQNLFKTTFYGYTLYHYMVLFELAFASSRLFSVLIFVTALEGGLLGAILTYPVSLGIAIIILVPFWWKVVSPLRGIEPSAEPVFRRVLGVQGPFVILMIPLKKIKDQSPVWIIQTLLGTEMVSIYAVAKTGYALFYSLLNSLETTLLPLTSERISVDWETTKNMLNKAVKYAFWASLALVAGGLLFAPLFYQFSFSAKYLQSVPVFQVRLLTLCIYGFFLIQRPLLYALQAQKQLFFSYLLSTMLFLPILWLLVSIFGVIGASIALIANAIIVLSLRYYSIQKLRPDFRIDLRDLFGVDKLDRRLFSRIRRKFDI
jgi:O-antigen/teichoic acid export membrane protein